MSYYSDLISLGITLKRTSGSEKTVCPKCSSGRKNKKDPCLSVNIDTGVYNCHNCGYKGNVAFKKKEVIYVKPIWTNNTQLSNKAVEYFKSRGIGQQVLIDMKITEGLTYMPQKQKECNTVQFNYFRDGELINTKYRTGDKCFKMFSGAELIFYNIDAIDSKEILIVEGEMDALSFIQAGYKSVLSVPNGASKGNQELKYLDNCWEKFENIEKIIIGVDNDAAGNSLMEELVRRLGDERCYIVDYKDCKDGNEYLLKYGEIELSELVANAKPVPLEGIFMANYFSEGLNDIYVNGLPKGDQIGIEKFDDHISFFPGHVTTVTGIPNHGKSDVVDQIAVALTCFLDKKGGVFSPENFPVEFHLAKLSEKITGKSFEGHFKITRPELDRVAEFINDYFFYILPKDDSFTLENILDAAKKLIKKHGIKFLIIDPWNTIEHQIPMGVSETNYVSMVYAKLGNFAKRYGIHIFMVAHPTKMRKEKDSTKYPVPTLYDIAGSANFFNKTDNGFCVYRDFETNVTTIYIQKIKFKHQGQIGEVEFYYDLVCGRFNLVGKQADRRNYLDFRQNVKQEETAIEKARDLFETEEPPF